MSAVFADPAVLSIVSTTNHSTWYLVPGIWYTDCVTQYQYYVECDFTRNHTLQHVVFLTGSCTKKKWPKLAGKKATYRFWHVPYTFR